MLESALGDVEFAEPRFHGRYPGEFEVEGPQVCVVRLEEVAQEGRTADQRAVLLHDRVVLRPHLPRRDQPHVRCVGNQRHLVVEVAQHRAARDARGARDLADRRPPKADPADRPQGALHECGRVLVEVGQIPGPAQRRPDRHGAGVGRCRGVLAEHGELVGSQTRGPPAAACGEGATEGEGEHQGGAGRLLRGDGRSAGGGGAELAEDLTGLGQDDLAEVDVEDRGDEQLREQCGLLRGGVESAELRSDCCRITGGRGFHEGGCRLPQPATDLMLPQVDRKIRRALGTAVDGAHGEPCALGDGAERDAVPPRFDDGVRDGSPNGFVVALDLLRAGLVAARLLWHEQQRTPLRPSHDEIRCPRVQLVSIVPRACDALAVSVRGIPMAAFQPQNPTAMRASTLSLSRNGGVDVGSRSGKAWIKRNLGRGPYLSWPTSQDECEEEGFVNIESGLIKVGPDLRPCDGCSLGTVCGACGGVTVPSGLGDGVVPVLRWQSGTDVHLAVGLTDDWDSLVPAGALVPVLLGTVRLKDHIIIADAYARPGGSDAILNPYMLPGRAAVVGWLGFGESFGIIVHAISIYTGSHLVSLADGVASTDDLPLHEVFSDPGRMQFSSMSSQAESAHYANAETYLERGQRAFGEGNDDRGRDEFDEYLSWLVALAEITDDPTEREGILEHVCKVTRQPGVALNEWTWGFLLRMRFHFAAAAEHLEAGYRKGDVSCAVQRGILAHNMDDPVDAEKWLLIAQRETPSTVTAKYSLLERVVSILIPAGRLDEALQALQERPEASTDDADLDVSLEVAEAKVRYLLGDVARAHASLMDIVEGSPTAEALCLLVRIASDQGRHEQVESLLADLRALDPESPWLAEALDLLSADD